MRGVRWIRRRLSSEAGFSLVELVSSMAIMVTVMGGITSLMVSGTKAEANLNKRFQAQSQARVAIDRMRRDVHCARGATAASSPAASVTLDVTGCSFAGASNNLTWCTVAAGTVYEIWRYQSSTCSGTGQRMAQWVTNQQPFTFYAASGSVLGGTGSRATMGVTMTVNLTPTKTERAYMLQTTIVLRNTTRPA